MKTHILKTIFLISIMILFSCQEESNFTPKLEFHNSTMFHDSKLISYFENLKWKDRLSKKDKNLILETIDSSYNLVTRDRVYEIIIPTLIHRFNISNERENLFLWELDRELYEFTQNMNEEEFNNYLLSLIIPECLAKNLTQMISHYHCKGDDYLDILVARQCRRLRNNLEVYVEIPDSLLNERQRYLLEFSKFESNSAIDKLFELANDYNLEENIYHGQISMTLASYGRNATLKSYSIFMDKNLLKEYSDFGKYIIAKHLSFKSLTDLNNEEILNLKNRISSINIEDEKIDKAKYVIKHLMRQFDDELN